MKHWLSWGSLCEMLDERLLRMHLNQLQAQGVLEVYERGQYTRHRLDTEERRDPRCCYRILDKEAWEKALEDILANDAEELLAQEPMRELIGGHALTMFGNTPAWPGRERP